MKITLHPVSNPELQPITVSGHLFAIGRSEPPFNEYDRNVVSRLSKRHAKVFIEHNRAYVADLNSTNGTSRNGEKVSDTPEPLEDDDEIGFGGLIFRVRIDHEEDPSVEPEITAHAQLVLTPLTGGRNLSAIVVSEFPYLVHRHSEMFALAAAEAGDQLSFISKRHAHFFQKGAHILIEDLGSTNGTFLNGVKLDEHAEPLNDSDTVAFGSDYFVYRAGVYVDAADDETRTQLIGKLTQADGTIFVESPASFIDIFQTGDQDQAGAGDDGGAYDFGPAAPRKKTPSARPERSTVRRRKHLWPPILAAGMLVVVVLGAGIWWMAGSITEDALYRMLDEGNYERAAIAANERLDGTGYDADIARIATTATLHSVLPEWTTALEAANRDQAATALRRAGTLGSRNPGDDDYLEVLQWAGDVHFLLAELDSGTVSDAAFIADAEGLLAWWRGDEQQHRETLGRLTGFAPYFEPTRRNILANVRSLMLRKQQIEQSQRSD